VTTEKNFNPHRWTVEMIVRLPTENVKNRTISILGWQSGAGNYSVMSRINTGSGVDLHVVGGKGQDGRVYEFHSAVSAGGNGSSIHVNAPNEWLYLAFGMDFLKQRVAVIVRDMNGDILKRNMMFAGNGGLMEDFLKGLPEEQKAGATARCWADMAKSFAKGIPPHLSFGSDQLDILKLRLSNTFRDDVLVPAPLFAEQAAWTADMLDPAKAKTQTLKRTLGYPGYNNQGTYTVTESTLAMAPGQAFQLPLRDMKIGIYSFYIYGCIDAKGRAKLEQVWKPCPIEFEAKDSKGRRVEVGQRLMKQSFGLRRMQGFTLHVNEPGDYTLTFKLMNAAQETPLIQRVVMVDHLAGLPDEAAKTSQNLMPGKNTQLKALDDARRKRDNDIWAALPSCNLQLQVHTQVTQFRNPPEGAKDKLGPWQLVHGGRPSDSFAPLDMVNIKTKEVFPNDKVVAGDPWPGEITDTGWGIFFSKKDYPELPHDIYNSPRANLLGSRIQMFLGLLGTWDYRGANIASQYFEKGDPNVGHDAAMALVRLAYDWPAVERNLHEQRLCTGSPDFEFNTDWSAERNGKYFGDGWSGDMASGLITAYDQLFPYIKDNTLFADEVHRFIPWVQTPQDVVRFLDRWLVFSSVKDFNRGLIRASNVADIAAQVLGPSPRTAKLLDLTQQYTEIYPRVGTYQEMYATALSRSGCYYIGSFMVYAYGSAQGLVDKAFIMKKVKETGFVPPMDISDPQKYPRVQGAANFMVSMWAAGGFPFMVGDASGGPHTGPDAANRVLGRSKDTIEHGFYVLGDPRFAYLLKNMYGSKDPAVLKAAEGVRDPVVNSTSHVVPDYAAFVEGNPDETDLTKKTAMTMRLGIGQGHAHSDYLDVNFFGMGLPLAVDLACRSEGGNWSRPKAAWGFLHNHAIAHDEKDPAKSGGQTGEPWLRAFAPPLVRGSYVNQKGDVRLDRDVMLMPVGDTGSYYAFDVQRLRGGKMHTWCFHGCESQELALNVPMAPKTVRWIDRTLEGTHKTGMAINGLQATWTMTRRGKDYAHKFTGGGVVRTVACEPTVLGKRNDPKLPPVKVRATLLGHAGEAVLQGNPYSQSYAYCFPFLWVQNAKAEGESVYPAIYEWYRGDAPVVTKAEITSKTPMKVNVTTASGQTDEYTVTPDGFSAISRDGKGLRWAKFSGVAEFSAPDVKVKAPAKYATTIVSMDYAARKLTTKDPLPENPGVVVGNSGRLCWLQLKGRGTSFTWDDDLLIHEGKIEEIKVLDKDTIQVRTNQTVLFGDLANRDTKSMVQCNEDLTWQFRGGKVIKKLEGAELTGKVFTDANGDGLINLKTYEVGIGDSVTVLSDIEIQRTEKGYAVKANVPVEGEAGGKVLVPPMR
jgi:hypothetical protein